MKLVVALLALCLSVPASARSSYQVRLFREENPCPVTGKTTGPCEVRALDDNRVLIKYVVDHMIPLCAGGPDHPSNMAWQEYQQSLVKDRYERELCARIRRMR